MPPPTFEFLVLSMKMQAELYLGLMGFGEENDAGPNLPAARHAIDLLAMISEKTRGNLSLEEQRLVENSLTELRFRFVQVTESAAKAPAAGAEEPAAAADKPVEAPAEAAAPSSGEPQAPGEPEPPPAGEAGSDQTAS